MTETGTIKKEEKPFLCTLLFTSTKLICVMNENTYYSFKDIVLHGLFPIIAATELTSTKGKDKQEQTEESESLDKILEKNPYFEVNYADIEKLELTGKALRGLTIKVSWNQRYVDKKLQFMILGEYNSENFVKTLRTTLPENFSETHKKSFLTQKYEWTKQT